jgi:hypothetical protein
MLGHKKVLLRSLINKEFSEGINKARLMEALERFIDSYYPEKGGAGVYFTHNLKTKILHELAFDIKQAGGLENWKKMMMVMSSPVVGSLPPKHKKQNQ